MPVGRRSEPCWRSGLDGEESLRAKASEPAAAVEQHPADTPGALSTSVCPGTQDDKRRTQNAEQAVEPSSMKIQKTRYEDAGTPNAT